MPIFFLLASEIDSSADIFMIQSYVFALISQLIILGPYPFSFFLKIVSEQKPLFNTNSFWKLLKLKFSSVKDAYLNCDFFVLCDILIIQISMW